MPELHLMCGLPGAGKSTLAKQLEASLPALRLSPDEWMALTRAPMDDPEAREAVEAEQWRVAARALELGVNVILENGFWKRKEREGYRACGEAVGAKVVLHYLDVPRAELLRRLALRYESVPAGGFRITPEMLELYASWFEPVSAEELV